LRCLSSAQHASHSVVIITFSKTTSLFNRQQQTVVHKSLALQKETVFPHNLNNFLIIAMLELYELGQTRELLPLVEVSLAN
jgi:hypothetical protein